MGRSDSFGQGVANGRKRRCLAVGAPRADRPHALQRRLLERKRSYLTEKGLFSRKAVWNGKIVEAEVYFGWTIPHEAGQRSFIAEQQ